VRKLCRVIKVINLYHYTSALNVSYLSEISFYLQLCSICIKFGMANCFGMWHCLCSGLVELNVIVQAQHINNRKSSNS
jgi:hypothetical protein